MKLLILLTLITCLEVSAEGFAQTVTLSLDNAPLEKAFKEIKKQTGYSFIYVREQLENARSLTVHVVNCDLKNALELCFRNQPLSFVVEDTYIVVQSKPLALRQVPVELNLIDVRGKIINEAGEALPGVSIMAKKTGKATSTDEQGNFFLAQVENSDVLSVSSVGYYREEIALNHRSNILIQLRIEVGSLDEAMVRGYYSTTRRFTTGSVSKVSGAQIMSQPVANPMLALQGLVPGLLITQSNGLPGARFSALIRGQSSIQNGSSPLYVIDGVPFLSDNENLMQLSGILANSPFNSLDPSNIESIEVLKDADATAIYGSKGANGVILITTKKPKYGESSIWVNFYQGWGKVTRTMNLMNTDQYLEMRKEAFRNDGVNPTNVNAPDLVSWPESRYTDWKKMFIGGTSTTSNAQWRYTGGNQATRFSLGAGWYRETTVFPGNFSDNRKTVDLHVDHHGLKDRLNIQLSSSYAYEKNILPSQDLTAFITLPPNSYPLVDSAGKYVWREAAYSVGNPLAILLQENRVVSDRLTANGVIAYRPIQGLEAKVSIGYNTVTYDQVTLAPIASQDPAYAPQGATIFGNNATRTWIIEPQIGYNFSIARKMKIELLSGSTLQKNNYNRKLITASGYTDDNSLTSMASASNITGSSSVAEYNYAGFYGRIGLNWNNKYLLNITGRRDGSSRFGPANRFANFGAVAGAWIFSKESFFERSLRFVSFGKLRGSFGSTGNDQIGNYQFLDTYRASPYPYQGQAAIFPSRLVNSNYGWERNIKMELAAELGFFNNRVQVSINWYKSSSDNQIIRYSLPNQTGFTFILKNFPGVVENKGIELSGSGVILNKTNLQWTTSVNVSRNVNTLLKFPGLESSSYAAYYVIGKPLNAYKGLQYTGVDGQTGLYQFRDLNGDGVINNLDYQYIGTTNPEWVAGFTNSVTCRRFQLSILLEYRMQLGRHAVYSSYILPGTIANQPVNVLNRWKKAGDMASYQKYSQDMAGQAYYPANYNMTSSNAALTDASYIRVGNLALSYQLPSKLINGLHCENWKVYCQAQNLFTITKFVGHDPENQSVSSLPPLRMVTAGMQLTF